MAKGNLAVLPVRSHAPLGGPDYHTTMLGRVVGKSEDGRPLVEIPAVAGGVHRPAFVTAATAGAPIGSAVTVAFVGGDPDAPIITGLMPVEQAGQSVECPVECRLDGKRVTLDAENEIVLRCGKASIVLTRDGRVVIKGTQLVSRSSGTNKIRGAVVQIN